jgi:hypothetical protein
MFSNPFTIGFNNPLNDVEAEALATDTTLGLAVMQAGKTMFLMCGEVDWGIKWRIVNPTQNKKGGYIIQKITILWERKDCKDQLTADQSAGGQKSPLTYWEAWYVAAFNAFPSDPNDGQEDHFTWGDEGCCGKGKAAWSGTAVFYYGVTALPANMTRDPNSFAKGLAFSTTDPTTSTEFSGATKTAALDHKMEIEWNCCPVKRHTKILSQTPAP